MAAPFSNAIGWAQFRILGGWRNLLATSLTYAFVGAAAMFGLVQAMHQRTASTFGIFMGIFLGLQVLVLLVYGTMRSAAAVRQDMTNRVIESHRLMPVSPVSAVAGYLFGGTLQALSLFVVNLVLGAMAARGAGIALGYWFAGNAVLLEFSIFLWTIVVFFAFRGTMAGGGVIFGIVGMFMSGGRFLTFLPGANVLVTPMIARSLFAGAGLTVGSPHVIGGCCQLAIGVLYFAAATRRYRSDEAVAFDPPFALMLLAAWTGTCVIGVLYEDLFSFFPMGFMGRTEQPAFITSLATVMLLAMLPVSSSVRLKAAPPRTSDPRRAPPILVALAAAAVTCAMFYTAPHVKWRREAVVRSVITVVAFLVAVRYLLGIAHRRGFGTRRLIVGFLVLTWLAPLGIEAFLQSAYMGPQPAPVSQIFMSSPMGELYQLWSFEPLVHSSRFEGLAFQCSLAVLLAILFYVIPRRRRK
jgi:hypothetical protein